MYIWVSANDSFPGNIDFAADDRGAIWYVYSSSVNPSLPSVNHEQFPMQMTHKHNKWLQIPLPGRISTETPLEWERRLQTQREQRRRRRQQETAKQKEHRLAQRRQRRQQETEEQKIGIRGILIVYCWKSFPADICTSKSATFQLCITARTIIIFRRTDICSLFLSFLNPDAEIMLNLLTIRPRNTQKRRWRKERITYGPIRRYSRLVTHPVLNPDPGGGVVLPYITYMGMCRPTGSWFWSCWFRTGYPFQRRFLERGVKNCGSRLYLLLKIVADYEEAFIWCISRTNKEISF